MILRKIRRKMAVCSVLAALLPLSVVPSVNAQLSSDKPSVEAIRDLLKVTDAAGRYKKLMPQINQQIWGAIAPKTPGIPGDLQKEISQEMTRQMLAMVPQIIELLIPIYRRHLTAVEVDAAIAFFSSPAGKSLTNKMALITLESFKVGTQVGRAMGERAAETAIQRLRDKGFQL